MSAAAAVQYAYTHAQHMHYVQLRHKDQEIKEIVVSFAAVSLTMFCEQDSPARGLSPCLIAGSSKRVIDSGRCCPVCDADAAAVCPPQLLWHLLQNHPAVHD